MSYDIRIRHADGSDIELPEPFMQAGGTYAVGGTTTPEFNITYNYAAHFRRVLDDEKGIRVLYGKTAREALPILAAGIAALGQDTADNYWQASEGNARNALCALFTLATLVPADAVFDGD